MFKKIFHTFWIKVVSVGFQFLIFILLSQYLGAEGKGVTSLITTSILIVILFNDIIGGSALVYVLPRSNFFKSIILSYGWALISTVVLTAVFYILQLVPREFIPDLFLLSIIYAIGSINLIALLSKEKVVLNNIIYLLMILSQLGVLLLYFFAFDEYSVQSYVNALYWSYGFSAVLSFIFIAKYLKEVTFKNFRNEIKMLSSYGIMVQIANILQFMNYRLSFYLLEFFTGTGAVGIYSNAVAISEAVWLFSKSMGLIQYARIANTSDAEYSKRLTIRLMKFGLMGTLLILIPGMLLPSDIYKMVFGDEFGDVKWVIISMAPGIAALGLGVILGNYFGGLGKYSINTIGSFVGFVTTIIMGLIFIPRFGYIGAGITATASYTITTIYMVYAFQRHSKMQLRELLITKEDFEMGFRELKTLFSSKKEQ